MRLTIRLNGGAQAAEVDPRMLLVEALRECFGASGPKIGCRTGDCGACTIEQDGKIVKSCLRLAAGAEGSRIRTIEGMAAGQELTALQQAFWDHHAFQCGYCVSGMLFAAEELLAREPAPDEAQIRAAIDGNLCRCTGYQNIVAAIRAVADREEDMNEPFALSGEVLPSEYRREPTHEGMIAERDVYVPTRDGVRLCVDVYRPPSEEPLPALLAFAVYNKDIQGPAGAGALPPQPAWSPLWTGPQEAGDTRFLVARGYAHVIGMPRGVGKSEGGGARTWDCYDLIEWIAAQPWCDGNVGMVGISGFGAEQMNVARQRPPHLRAIFPFDPRGAYGTLGGFREEYPGGVLHLFRYLVGHFGVLHQDRGAPGELSPARETLWRAAMDNPDYQMYPHLYNVLTMRGQLMPPYFETLIDPYEPEGTVERSEAEFEQIEVPTYTGSGWYGYTYKTHLGGAQTYWRHLRRAPKKLLFAGPAHLERPFHTFHGEILRWYDHWLKGIDTGVIDEPPVRYWVMGANEWRTGEDWPLPETRWTDLHLDSWERLRSASFTPASVDDAIPPDSFVQMPLTHTSRVAGLRYLSEPLAEDLLIAGPVALVLHAAIDQTDTNWIVALSDLGPDPSVRTVREGERELPRALPERELTRGWLKASNRALDPARSTPWKPFHRLTRAAAQPVIPGEVTEYRIELLATANLFRAGHRIGLRIMSMDAPTGVAGATNAEYVPYHVCSARTTLHTIYHDTAHPSRLILPVIPAGEG